MTTVQQRKPLGEALIEKGLLTQEHLNRGLEENKKTGMPLRKVLVRLGYVDEEAIVNFFMEQTKVRRVELKKIEIDPAVVKLVPETLARKYEVLAIEKKGDTLVLAMINPLDIKAIDEIQLKTGFIVEPVVMTELEIQDAFIQFFGLSTDLKDLIETIDEAYEIKEAPMDADEEGVDLAALQGLAQEAPTVKMVNYLLMQAIKEDASDIHIEPGKDRLRIRFRVEGVLKEVSSPPRKYQDAIISRVKILSGLDIAERRLPQDGRYRVRVGEKEIDMRVSSLPTVDGENVVIRLLYTSMALPKISELGFPEDYGRAFDRLIHASHGIFLVTGPTGSGKTTTLYCALHVINSIDKNIITVEDPVEYRLNLIRQVQVNPKAGLTFAAGLRSILRQDPNIVMVGEIRDKETVEIAIQAALTGHLVLSTLHTNDAAASISRLIDMGAEPYLIASSVLGVLAQRLVREICPECKESYEANPSLLMDLGMTPPSSEEKVIFYRGKGCPNCKDTGYKGRTGIFELMLMDERIRGLTIAKVPADEIKKAAIAGGMRTLREEGINQARKGITTVEEVLRVTQIG